MDKPTRPQSAPVQISGHPILPPSAPGGRFQTVAFTKEEEDSYDILRARNNPKPTGLVGSIAHIVKGALGGGVLSGHVAYMKAGYGIALPLNVLFGMYIGYCLHVLGKSSQILYKRTKIPSMSYPDVGEAAVSCFPNPKIAKFSKIFRYMIDAVIIIELFGACTAYQVIIAKSIKQLVEDTQRTSDVGLGPGYPSLRIYILIMLVPIILICLIRHLKYLAPFSIFANMMIVFAMCLTVYYALTLNPTFSNIQLATKFYNLFEYIGMIVFSMNCAGIILPIENNMREPQKLSVAIFFGMSFIIAFVAAIAMFGYVAYQDKCESPITVNFPMTIVPKILKGCIACMIYITHAINFWAPFNLCFYYIKKRHSENRIVLIEYIYRVLFVCLICMLAIAFPNINALMGFLGAFCISNMAFLFPNIIDLLVIWHRPGLGKYKFRLWRAVILMVIGVFILIIGTAVNVAELIGSVG